MNESECAIPYGESTSYPQSTTGNVSGVYDMSGGLFEYVMGNYGNKSNPNYFSKLPESKYYDVYLSNTFNGIYSTNMSKCTSQTCGDMLYLKPRDGIQIILTLSVLMAHGFVRGGNCNGGYSSNFDGFRSVLVVNVT